MDIRTSEGMSDDLIIFKFDALRTTDSDDRLLLREKMVGGEEDDPLRRIVCELVLL